MLSGANAFSCTRPSTVTAAKYSTLTETDLTAASFGVTLACAGSYSSTGTPTAVVCTEAGVYTVTDPCTPDVTGKCTGNTGGTGDVDCSGETTNTQNKGAAVDGTDAATCCEAPTVTCADGDGAGNAATCSTNAFFFGGGTLSASGTCSGSSCTDAECCMACDPVNGGEAPTVVTCSDASNSQLTGNCATGKYKLAGTATTCPVIVACDSSRNGGTAATPSVDGVSNNVCAACTGNTFAVGNAACSAAAACSTMFEVHGGSTAGFIQCAEGKVVKPTMFGSCATATCDATTDLAACCIAVTGKCTGNTGGTGDVDCSGETTNTVNKGATVAGTTAAACCEAPAATNAPAPATNAPAPAPAKVVPEPAAPAPEDDVAAAFMCIPTITTIALAVVAAAVTM